MTDELSIQPQVIQKRDNSAIYGGIGALAGAGAGYGINRWVQKPMSHEDIVKEVNDKDKFETRTKEGAPEVATWKEVKEKAEEVQRLKEEAEKTPEKKLPDGAPEIKNLEDAKKARDIEFARLVTQEKAKTSGSKVTGFPTEEQLKAKLTTKEYAIAEPYVVRYENAKSGLLGVKGKGGTLQPLRNNVKSLVAKDASGRPVGTVNRMYNGFFTTFDALTDKEKAKANVIEKNFGKEIDSLINKELEYKEKFFKRKDLDELKELQEKYGTDFIEITEEKTDGIKGKWVYEKFNSKGKKVWVIVDKEGVKAKREALRAEYRDNARKYIDKATELKGFDKEFFEANKEALKTDLRIPVSSASGLKAAIDGKYIVPFSDALKTIDIERLKLEKGLNSYPITLGAFNIKNEHELNVLQQQIEAQLELCKKYVNGRNAISHEMAKIVNADPRVVFAKAQVRKAVANDSGVKKAIEDVEKLNGKYASEEEKKVYQAIKEMMDVEATSELSQTEIEEKVRKAMEGGSFEARLKNAQEAYDKALEAKGVTNEEAKKKAQEALEAAEKTLKEKAEALGKKMAKGGINPWLAGGIGAVALGLATFGLTKPKNS